MKNDFVRISPLIVYFGLILFSSCSQKKEKVPSGTKTPAPNFVFLLVDDLGWKDLACYGSAFYETPNIDRLAKQGMRFTDAYAAAAVCSPTRASILTGKYPARLNITDWIPGADPKDKLLLGSIDKHELPLNETTFAERLKKENYATAFYGKWHLGEPGFFPEDQGFDINKGGHWAGQPASYFFPYKNKHKRWDVPGLENGEEGEYLTDRLTSEANQFISQNKDLPFLLYLAYYNVHTPIQAKPELFKKYEAKKKTLKSGNKLDYINEHDARTKQKQDNPAYAGMVQSVDESVGRIMNQLDALNLSENTIIIFTSDNGGLTTLPKRGKSPTSVLPLRAGKGWLYEGGIRVPTIINWPGHIVPNSTCEIPIISMDFYPTILEMAGLPKMPEQHNDGKSLVPLLKETNDFSRAAIYWHYPHYHGSLNRPGAAIRSGDYKLVEWFEDGVSELYNLKNDIGEEKDLSEIEPDKLKELSSKLYQWQQSMGAKFPSPNQLYKK